MLKANQTRPAAGRLVAYPPQPANYPSRVAQASPPPEMIRAASRRRCRVKNARKPTRPSFAGCYTPAEAAAAIALILTGADWRPETAKWRALELRRHRKRPTPRPDPTLIIQSGNSVGTRRRALVGKPSRSCLRVPAPTGRGSAAPAEAVLGWTGGIAPPESAGPFDSRDISVSPHRPLSIVSIRPRGLALWLG